MTNELVPSIASFTQEHIKVIKDMCAQDCSDAEFQAFLMLCKRAQLDPIAKQIYMTKMGGKNTIIVGIDGFRLVAERTGRYAPGREPTFEYDKSGNLISATAYVKKQTRDGTWHEVAASAHWKEYAKPGSGGTWGKIPHVMLAKCAESQALRRAFPNDLSGLYTKEEMEQAEVEEVKKSKADMESRMLERPTIEVKTEEVAKEPLKRHTFDDIYEVCVATALGIDREELADFISSMANSATENSKGKSNKVWSSQDIIDSCYVEGGMARFLHHLDKRFGLKADSSSEAKS